MIVQVVSVRVLVGVGERVGSVGVLIGVGERTAVAVGAIGDDVDFT